MLQLKGVTKDYVTSSETVHALRGIDIAFRDREFVSILGPSGCGKTTLLNIIGGLDQYTSGDLVINGKSTKLYRDRDWDVYRNHRVGFIFQSYNLIPHQTVLGNVELALTIAGIGKKERVERAKRALDKVGLKGQYHKRPNQLSGGQCQRVAIARALVNDPEILLADEPTGALDTVTSVQIMDLIREISGERLVIMVTHNPELAKEYSTRTVSLKDGEITEDTMPVTEGEIREYERSLGKVKASSENKTQKKKKSDKEMAKMSFSTAFSLSMNNLATKKGRTVMTSLAGSIGIVGIALILALSTGINAFIAQVQEDTLSAYPLTIQKNTQDMSAMFSAMTTVSDTKDYSDTGMIHVDDSLGTMMSAMSSTVENNLTALKEYIDANYDEISDCVSDIQYTYDYDLQVYTADGKIKIGMETVFEHMGDAFSGMSDLMEMSGGMSMGFDAMSEMIGNQELLDQQYDVIAGHWPEEYNEVVLVVNSNNQISKMTLYMLGMLDPSEIEGELEDLMNGTYESSDIPPYTYEDILGTSFKLLTTADFFGKTDKTYTVEGDGTVYPVWNDMRESFGFDSASYVAEHGVDIRIAGIVRPHEGATATSISGAIGYTKELTNYILDKNADSEVINQQKSTPGVNVLTGLAFERTVYTKENIMELIDKIDSEAMDAFYGYMTEFFRSSEEIASLLNVTRANINSMFMLLSEEQQAKILSDMVKSAVAADPSGAEKVFATISSMTGGIEVTEKNITVLLPVLNKMETMPVIMAIGIPGIAALADSDTVDGVIALIKADHPEIPSVTRDNLSSIMTRLSQSEQTRHYQTLIGSIDESGDTMLSVLCAILSEQAKTEFTKDNLAQKLPSLPPYMSMVSSIIIGGIPGFADYADDDTMSSVYAEMSGFMRELEVDDEIFSLFLLVMTDDEFAEMEKTLYSMAPQIDADYESVLLLLDDAEKASPASINFYARDFESKDKIEEFIADYNGRAKDEGRDGDVIQYSDIVGSLMSSVTTIIDAISYVLIAFVSISLVVSSVMIGIITNISVLERIKEIGVLRAIGASKRDISRVFNAETLIIGLASGIFGIVITLLLCIPITAIVQSLTGIDSIRAILPWQGAVSLVVISMMLTLIAGIIPSRSAARKDPVVALRTE